jgi:hypothetical protein
VDWRSLARHAVENCYKLVVYYLDSGLVFRSGRGDSTVYRAAEPDEYTLAQTVGASRERLDNLVWIAVYRHGPISLDELENHVPSDESALGAALARLEAAGRIQRSGAVQPTRYESQACVIAESDPAGSEAAVFDHYQAVVTAICTKVRLAKRSPELRELIGGSTYGFEVWDDHPQRDAVLGFLKQTRERAVALRELVAEHNAANETGANSIKVIAYVGQTLAYSGAPSRHSIRTDSSRTPPACSRWSRSRTVRTSWRGHPSTSHSRRAMPMETPSGIRRIPPRTTCTAARSV